MSSIKSLDSDDTSATPRNRRSINQTPGRRNMNRKISKNNIDVVHLCIKIIIMKN